MSRYQTSQGHKVELEGTSSSNINAFLKHLFKHNAVIDQELEIKIIDRGCTEEF
jgi:hypothetical protein